MGTNTNWFKCWVWIIKDSRRIIFKTNIMTIIENLWILLTIIIIFFILSTDPKTSSSQTNQANIISSVSEGQKSIRTFIWILVGCFYILSLLISYY